MTVQPRARRRVVVHRFMGYFSNGPYDHLCHRGRMEFDDSCCRRNWKLVTCSNCLAARKKRGKNE